MFSFHQYPGVRLKYVLDHLIGGIAPLYRRTQGPRHEGYLPVD